VSQLSGNPWGKTDMKFIHTKREDIDFRKVRDFAPESLLKLLSESDRHTEMGHHFNGEDGGLALMEVIEAPNGQSTLHSHDKEEIFYVVEGALVFGKRVCKAGDSINIKAGVQYTFKVGSEGCRYLKFTATTDPSLHIAQKNA